MTSGSQRTYYTMNLEEKLNNMMESQITRRMKQFILLSLLAVLLGCTSNKRVNDSPLANGTDTVMLSRGYDEVKLFKSKTGHITATISVNGKPCVFLIDTGGGATLIDQSKRQKYDLKASKTSDYAAGIGSVSTLVRTSATFQINGYNIKEKDLYLMDISYMNYEFKKNHSRQVDGVLGTDFLDKYGAVIDYSRLKLYLRIQKHKI